MQPPRGVSPDAPSVLGRFHGTVLHNPDAAAVSFEGQDLSYRELSAAADALAARLRAHGAGPGGLVAIAVERSPDLIVAILGVLESGAAYVPIDPTCPESRVRMILEDSRAAWLVTTGAFDGIATPAIVRVPARVDGDTIADAAAAPLVEPAPETRAYVIDASDAGERPKGVQVTHANLAWFLSAYRPVLDYGPTDVWSQSHACSLDVAASEIFGALTSGGRLVIVPASIAGDPARFAALVDHEGVTVLTQAPASFVALGREPALTGQALRVVAIVGERVDPSQLSPWFQRFPYQPKVLSLYGPAETTVGVMTRVVTSADVRETTHRIGRPMQGVTITIADARGEPVADGHGGEIWIGGPCVTAGYFGRPDLTSARFCHRTERHSTAVFYRTGDRGRRSPNGDIEWLGRLDAAVP